MQCRLFDYGSEMLDTAHCTAIDAIEDAESLMHLLFSLHLNKLLLLQSIKRLGLTTQPVTVVDCFYLIEQTVTEQMLVTILLVRMKRRVVSLFFLRMQQMTGDPSYLINEEYIVGDQSTDKVNQNELFDELDDEILDFSESNPFGDAGEPS